MNLNYCLSRPFDDALLNNRAVRACETGRNIAAEILQLRNRFKTAEKVANKL